MNGRCQTYGREKCSQSHELKTHIKCLHRVFSEGVLWSTVKVVGELALESLGVGAEVGVLEEDGLAELEDGALFVLHDVEEEAGEDEVSNGHLVTTDELVCCVRGELILDNGQILGQDTRFPGLHLLALLLVGGEEERLGDRVEHVGPGVDKHVDHTGSLPVSWVVVAVLDSKLAENRIGLLSRLAILGNDRHASKFTSVSSGLARTPLFLADGHSVKRNMLVGQKHDKRSGSGVSAREVLNLDDLVVVGWLGDAPGRSSRSDIFT